MQIDWKWLKGNVFFECYLQSPNPSFLEHFSHLKGFNFKCTPLIWSCNLSFLAKLSYFKDLCLAILVFSFITCNIGSIIKVEALPCSIPIVKSHYLPTILIKNPFILASGGYHLGIKEKLLKIFLFSYQNSVCFRFNQTNIT